jgi:hypothetical protein
MHYGLVVCDLARYLRALPEKSVQNLGPIAVWWNDLAFHPKRIASSEGYASALKVRQIPNTAFSAGQGGDADNRQQEHVLVRRGRARMAA